MRHHGFAWACLVLGIFLLIATASAGQKNIVQETELAEDGGVLTYWGIGEGNIVMTSVGISTSTSTYECDICGQEYKSYYKGSHYETFYDEATGRAFRTCRYELIEFFSSNVKGVWLEDD